jgi:indolepyruvate ferredoxin oxidoreductase beta subunit
MEELNIIISGVGGQGNVLLEQLIGLGAIKEGHRVRAADTYGASQRGGSVVSHLRLGQEISSSLIPKGRAHVVVGLEPCETLRAAREFICKNGLIVFNSSPVLPVKVKTGEASYPPLKIIMSLLQQSTRNIVHLDATALAKEKGVSRSANIAMLGVLMGLAALPLGLDTIRETIFQVLGITLAQANIVVFDAGLEIGEHERLHGKGGNICMEG